MKAMLAANIQWVTDGITPVPGLPDEVLIPDWVEGEDAVSDYLSDVFGFLHEGFTLEEAEVIRDPYRGCSPAVRGALENLNTVWEVEDLEDALRCAGKGVTPENLDALARQVGKNFTECVIQDISERLETAAETV